MGGGSIPHLIPPPPHVLSTFSSTTACVFSLQHAHRNVMFLTLLNKKRVLLFTVQEREGVVGGGVVNINGEAPLSSGKQQLT